jgi:hypothetical protein
MGDNITSDDYKPGKK